MEEEIQIIIDNIWETNTNSEDLLLQKLYKISFQDTINKDQKIFLCSRLINSNENLFKYLNSKCGITDRKSTSFRGKIIEFLKDFITEYEIYCMDYLEYIYKMSIGIYSSEQSMIVKEKILKLTAKIMEKFPVDIVEKIYKPKQYLENLLNEIRLSKLTSTIKGGIWSIIGILIGKFSILLNSYKIEVHDVIFADFKKIVSQKKPEIKALQGILKGYEYLLDDPHLKANDIEELYHYLKSLIHPLDDANTIKINKLALKVISEHGKVFTQQLQRESIELFDLVFELCNHKNY